MWAGSVHDGDFNNILGGIDYGLEDTENRRNLPWRRDQLLRLRRAGLNRAPRYLGSAAGSDLRL